MSAAVVVEYPHDRRMSMQMMQASFESLLDPSLLSLDSLAATFDHARRSSAVSLRFSADADVDTLDVDAMFDSMFAGPNHENNGSVSSGSEFESEKAELESLLSESYATSEHTEVPDGARSVQSTPMFAPVGSFPSMVIPTNTAHSILIPTDLPTTKQPLASIAKTTSPTSLVPSYAAGSRKKPSTKRPRSQSNPQYVAPTMTTAGAAPARQPIARNASTASVPEHLLSSLPIVAIPMIKEEPASPVQPHAGDYLDMLTRSTLGPDPALLEDAKLDEIEDAMIDEGCEDDGEKKGKKRRRRTTAELSTSELETRRLKNSEAARRCRLRKALRVKWLEARVKELEEMNGLLVGKLRERN